MRFAGQPSWRLSTSTGSSLDDVLWMRDALGLEVSDELSPPPSAPQPPDRTALLAPDDRPRAAARWSAWWLAALAHEAADQLEEPPAGTDAFLAWVRERGAAREAVVGAPPDFAALADEPALQRAVAWLHPEARGVRAERESGAGAGGPAMHPRYHDAARETAGWAARTRGIPVGDVRGAVLVLAVDGAWWRPVEPGVVACSASCLDDGETTRSVLRTAFSG